MNKNQLEEEVKKELSVILAVGMAFQAFQHSQEQVDKDMSKSKSKLLSLFTKRQEEVIGELEGDKKGVDELLPTMGDAYNNLAVQVAYKEGFNMGLVEAISIVKKI